MACRRRHLVSLSFFFKSTSVALLCVFANFKLVLHITTIASSSPLVVSILPFPFVITTPLVPLTVTFVSPAPLVFTERLYRLTATLLSAPLLVAAPLSASGIDRSTKLVASLARSARYIDSVAPPPTHAGSGHNGSWRVWLCSQQALNLLRLLFDPLISGEPQLLKLLVSVTSVSIDRRSSSTGGMSPPPQDSDRRSDVALVQKGMGLAHGWTSQGPFSKPAHTPEPIMITYFLKELNLSMSASPGYVYYSYLDSHSPFDQVNVKSSQLGPSHRGLYGAKQYWLNLCLLVTAGSIVQECCFARFVHDYLTAATLTHYAVSSIDGSSQNRICDLSELLIAWFSGTSSQIGLRSLNVAYDSRTSHLKFLPVNLATRSYRCFNVVFDYQLFERTITMGLKVELLFGFLHFAELDSPLNGSIFNCFAMFSSFFLLSSISPGIVIFLDL